jgi:hypothetical protein
LYWAFFTHASLLHLANLLTLYIREGRAKTPLLQHSFTFETSRAKPALQNGRLPSLLVDEPLHHCQVVTIQIHKLPTLVIPQLLNASTR